MAGRASWATGLAEAPPRGRRSARHRAASAGRDWPDPTESSEHHGPSPSERAADNETFDDDGEMAEVIPLPVFDARKEAQTWRL